MQLSQRLSMESKRIGPEPKKPRVVFDFVRSPRQRLDEVRHGRAPRESLMAYVELESRGWQVKASDDRWSGRLGELRTRLMSYIEIPSVRMMTTWASVDAVVVVTRFSVVLALIAKLLGKRIYFADAQFDLPKRLLSRWHTRLALRMADGVLCLSEHQARSWRKSFNLPGELFRLTGYSLDPVFFKQLQRPPVQTRGRPVMLSIGRDPGRDFTTLSKACTDYDCEARIVTLPYLLTPIVQQNPRVQVFSNVSYGKLFELYATSDVAVIPLVADIEYMSGIRAVMEGLLLGIPVIATRTPCLEEYFTDGVDILMVEAGDAEALAEAAWKVTNDRGFSDSLVKAGRRTMEERWSFEGYVRAIEKAIR